MANSLPAIPLILVTLLLPPLGVLLLAGCGPDLAINICLTILGYFPGHVHAFYLVYIYYNRNEKIRQGVLTAKRAPGIYSDEIQSGLSAVYDADNAEWRKSEVSKDGGMVSSSKPGIEPQLVDSKNGRAAQWTRVMRRSKDEDC